MKYVEEARNESVEVCIWGAGHIGTQFGLTLLKKRDIHVDYFCDNNPLLWGKVIMDGIQCISPNELKVKADNVVCFVMVGVLYCDDVLVQIEELGIKRVVQYNDLINEETKSYFAFMKKKSIAVYTCIVGDYDELQEPLSVSSECDYFVISDKRPDENSVFQYIDIKTVLPENIMDNTRKNRYCKINAHKIFPQYRYSIYFDGNIQLDQTIVELIKELPKTRLITFCPNYWSSVYREIISVLQNGRDDEQLVTKQAEVYWLSGMPDDYGGFMCGILIREHNNPVCMKIMEEWWQQVKKYSARDQIALPYVLWKNGYVSSDVGVVEKKYNYINGGKYWRFKKEHLIPRINKQRIVDPLKDYGQGV